MSIGGGGSQYIDKTNTIHIDPADLAYEYQTALPNEIPDGFNWDSYPDTNKLSVRRILFHEAYHSTQPSGVKFLLQQDYFENQAVNATNEFMWKHYQEPYRDGYK